MGGLRSSVERLVGSGGLWFRAGRWDVGRNVGNLKCAWKAGFRVSSALPQLAAGHLRPLSRDKASLRLERRAISFVSSLATCLLIMHMSPLCLPTYLIYPGSTAFSDSCLISFSSLPLCLSLPLYPSHSISFSLSVSVSLHPSLCLSASLSPSLSQCSHIAPQSVTNVENTSYEGVLFPMIPEWYPDCACADCSVPG